MLATFKSWLRRAHKPRFTRPRLGFQQLETREVPAALLDLAGILTITGTSDNDTLEIVRSASTVTVLQRGISDLMERMTSTGRVPAPDGFEVSAIHRVNVYSSGGNDWIDLGQSPVWAFVSAGDGNDTVHGSVFNDYLYGGAGNDRIAAHVGNDRLYGNGGNDRLEGWHGNDTLYGGAGDDGLHGEVGDDSLYGDQGSDILWGNSGHDILWGGLDNDTLNGGAGNDRLRGGVGEDKLNGNVGNDELGSYWNGAVWVDEPGYDRLYGGPGDDILRGGSGNDGLFGGAGSNTLTGGSEADRFLKWEGGAIDSITDQASEDAVLKFKDTPDGTTTTLSGFSGDFTFDPGFWTEVDIVRVDSGLENLHRHTWNTALLKKADGGELGGFKAVGRQTSGAAGIAGWNRGGEIVFVDPAAMDTNGILATIYHEIGHNWDDGGENRYIDGAGGFRSLSGWVEQTGSPGSNYTASAGTGDNWWHLTAASFAYDYGKWNPREDYATTFEKYFMERYHVGDGGWTSTAIPQKFANLERLFDDLLS